MSRSTTSSDRRAAQRVTLTGALSNVCLALVKAVGGLLLNSKALLADAVDSTADLVSDVITLIAVRVARKPIDENHPYGYGRVESLASLLIGGLLVLVATLFAINAVRSVIHGHRHEVGAAGMVIAGIAVIAKEALFHWTLRIGKQIRSRVVESNAWHHRSDALSSVSVFIGLGLGVIVPGADSFDALASLVVTVFIARTGLRIAIGSMHDLVDTEQDPDLLTDLERIAMSVPDVVNTHRVRTRRYGPHTWVDLDIEVDPDMPVAQGHLVAHEVKERILEEIQYVADVLVHVEPEGSHLHGEGTVRGM
ncbi:MAG: cation diffusion facilitator family transporter [bacterium]